MLDASPTPPHGPTPPLRCAVIQQAQQLPHNYAAWPMLALMALFVYATFPPALAGAKEEVRCRVGREAALRGCMCPCVAMLPGPRGLPVWSGCL